MLLYLNAFLLGHFKQPRPNNKISSQPTIPFTVPQLQLVLGLVLVTLFLTACGGSNSTSDSTGNNDQNSTGEADSEVVDVVVVDAPSNSLKSIPDNIVAVTLSASTSRITWEAPTDSDEGVLSYVVYRNETKLAETINTNYYDTELDANTAYSYYVVSKNENGAMSEASNIDEINTLISDSNIGLQNGGLVRTGQANFFDTCGSDEFRGRQFTIESLEDGELDECLAKIFDFHDDTLAEGLEDMQAFVARLRRQEDLALIGLGKRLFHSKTLSKNNDTSCSSCHHPALSCGGDALSLPIGVSASEPNLLGPGRTDGNAVPSVGRHSSHICNSALWIESMFWDKRVSISESNAETPSGTVSLNEVRTPDRVVTDAVNDYLNTHTDQTDPLKLLMAQAHFPVSATHEMGDSEGFDSDVEYREHLAGKLDERWDDYFIDAFGSAEKNFTLTARAIAAYQASALFIDNPFFSYVKGDINSIDNDEKRGAIMFWSSESGCSNCHDGAFFTPEVTRGPLYPQMGPNAVADGTGNGAEDGSPDKNQFRMPSLLNVGLTAPYGDKGAFQTLERVIHHYDHVKTSLEEFYGNQEACALPQFQHLSASECVDLVNGGEDYILDLNIAQIEEANGVGAPGPTPRNFTNQEIKYLVAFLNSLTDPSAVPGSPEINILIPTRDGGPDGNQLDAIDQNGDAL